MACLLTLLALAPAVSAQTSDTLPRIVRGLRFTGNKSIDSDRLASSIGTTNSSWFATFPVIRALGLGETRAFDEQEFVRDVIRLRLLYRASGFPTAKVDTVVARVRGRKEVSVYVTFRITEGAPVLVQTLKVAGLDSLPPRQQRDVVDELPLAVGDPFDRVRLQTSIDTIAHRLRNRGYPNADIFREFTSDVPKHTADVTLNVETGQRVRFGDVRVEGAQRVDSGLVRKLTGLRPGPVYSEDRLLQAQRSLYRTDLFRYATVTTDSTARLPSDSAAAVVADSTIPLLIRVQDAPPKRLRLGAGYGTTDCFRASSGLLLRNFAGDGRLLEVTGRVSKVGVGAPTDAGLANNLCKQLESDSIGSLKLNYSVQVTLRQPGFLGFQNTLALSAFAERRSEYKVYLRQEVGLGATITRESPRRRLPITLGYTITNGTTTALPATFCASFGACTPDLVALQEQRRTLGLLTFSIARPRANSLVDPTRGSNATLEISHSATWLGSASLNTFTRIIGDAAFYKSLGNGFVLSGRARGGIIFAPSAPSGSIDSANANFVPLEQRFFGGGPNDVRGYQRNQLGPVVYVVRSDTLANYGGNTDSLAARGSRQVTVAATGGNTLAVGNLELRIPTPVFAGRLRLAMFVDGGSVWQRGAGGTGPAFRLSPGLGVRFATPLGPFRFDAAYNSVGLETGRLYASDPNPGIATLTLVTDTFRTSRGFPVTFHVSVGQPF